MDIVTIIIALFSEIEQLKKPNVCPNKFDLPKSN